MRKSLFLACAAALTLPAVAQAQSGLEGRVGKLEGEMRAVQRKVFPGGAGALVLPDVTGPAPGAEPAAGSPATSAVADLTDRVGALERQVATLTGQVEQNGYQIRQMQDQFDAYRRRTDERISALTAPPAAVATAPYGAGDANGRAGSDTSLSTPPSRRPATRPRPSDTAASSADEPATRPAATVAANAVEKPSTGNPAEDEYMYGYRLWAAKRYPDAEAQLKKVVADFPKTRRASYAQNLLGRSYLDEGKPSLASMAFYDNYKKMPDGERAADSLYYLGQALMKLNKPADACKVYGELTDVYGGKISAAMKSDVERGRAAAKCQ